MPEFVPRPLRVQWTSGSLTLTQDSTLCVDARLAPAGRVLRRHLLDAADFELTRAVDHATSTISIREVADLPVEGYRLTVGSEQVVLEASDQVGALHGAQTLLQLMPPQVYRRAKVSDVEWRLPKVVVEDWPRFPWRGVMLDVARHFIPKRDVLRFIDLVAMHRLNTLHWHLTDDQGWRIEVRRYPGLTDVASWRAGTVPSADPHGATDARPHGGFYTQDDIREVVAYAAERGVTVVPEIDLPGHSQAAITAYPELGLDPQRQAHVRTNWGVSTEILNLEETTVDFFRNVLDEVMELFPSEYIGIGGDECPHGPWESDARTRELMHDRGLSTGVEAQAWFMRCLADHLMARGRRAFGWDELLQGEVPSGTLIASWRGMAGVVTAARRGLDVIACPDNPAYLDYRQSDDPTEPIPVGTVNDLERAYAFRLVPGELTPEEAKHVLGGQANLWTEHMDSARVVDYFAFPRLAAIAEVLWSGEGGDFAEFSSRLAGHLRRLDEVGVEYRRESGPLPWQRRPGLVGRPQSDEDRDAAIAQLLAGT